MPDTINSAAIRVGYVVKRYPRFSETFIVNEILAHEAAGWELGIFALQPSVDTHFQNLISQVRAPVTYLPSGSVKSTEFWTVCREASQQFPDLWAALEDAKWATAVDAFQAIQLAKHSRAQKFDHLHAHFATSPATVAQLAARIAGISYSITMHAKDIFHESVIEDDLANKIADAKFIVTVSDFNRDFLIEKFGFAARIHRIYNGLDLDLFAFNRPNGRTKKIISVGRLVHKKGFSQLIDACRILRDKGVEFECEIIGEGELELELRNQIASMEMCNQVRMTGPQPQNIVRQKILSAAVFAAPCVVGPDGNQDGLPTVITESLALGTPCISTDVTGIPEIIRNGETGVMVQQENSSQLAVEIERLLSHPEIGQSLAINARELIEQNFNIHENVSHLRRLFLNQVSRSVSANPQRLQGV